MVIKFLGNRNVKVAAGYGEVGPPLRPGDLGLHLAQLAANSY
jgi:hypothetical protein